MDSRPICIYTYVSVNVPHLFGGQNVYVLSFVILYLKTSTCSFASILLTHRFLFCRSCVSHFCCVVLRWNACLNDHDDGFTVCVGVSVHVLYSKYNLYTFYHIKTERGRMWIYVLYISIYKLFSNLSLLLRSNLVEIPIVTKKIPIHSTLKHINILSLHQRIISLFSVFVFF